MAAKMYGIVYFLINIRFLFWRGRNWKSFLIKTLIGSAAISIFASIIPIPKTPIVDSVVASVLIAVLSMVLVWLAACCGGSGGGVDVIGMWAARKFKNASVGKISLYVNVVVYASLLLMFDIEIVIYSLIYMVFFTLMMDRVHYQNITVRLMIFTKQEGIDQKILKQTGRGVTEWTGVGAYTKEETKIMICCINKFETAEFVEIIHSIDPKAFVIADEGVSVMSGNFEKRL
ncbi:MAG: YitT family protein [Lachnospiraceae bacterium]